LMQEDDFGGWVRTENYEALQVLCDRLQLEAQCHAQEARTANATIAEIYRLVSGGTGEPGNWNGAEPVQRKLEELQAECERLRKEAERYRWLRDKSVSLHSFYLSTPMWMTGVRFRPENVDSTIDAAMQTTMSS